jgi:hypothetical protein
VNYTVDVEDDYDPEADMQPPAKKDSGCSERTSGPELRPFPQ